MQVREGGDFDEAMIDRDIRSLYRTGLFEFIEIKQEPVDAHNVNLVVEVTPKFRVLAIRFEGNKQVKTSRLEKEIKTKSNTRPRRTPGEGRRRETPRLLPEGRLQPGLGHLHHRAQPGQRIRHGHFQDQGRPEGQNHGRSALSGNDHVKAEAAHKGEMETKKWWMFSWLTGTGLFKDDQFEDDLDKLRDFYREQGYLDVEIPQEKIAFDYPSRNRLIITITVNEGRRYRIGDISITGSKLHPEALLKRILRQKSGAVFSPSKIDKDRERLEEFYGRDGHLDTQVQLTRKSNITTGNIDLVYQVNESDKFTRRVHRHRGQHQDQEHRHPARTGARPRRRVQHGVR